MSRTVCHQYTDPLDQIWITTAARIGLRVRRSNDVYASVGPTGTLSIGNAEHLDADDSLAQMIFHELCHSLVEGHDSFERSDWGLDNTSDADLPREQACLRAQATLAQGYGLRRFLAPTTDHRAFYDNLEPNALTPAFEPSVTAAVIAIYRADRHPWGPHLRDALAATARIAATTHEFQDEATLWSMVDEPPPTHGVGIHQTVVDAASRRCADCAWLHVDGDKQRCRQAENADTESDAVACERWEPPPDCLACGACCREAYQSVGIVATETAIQKHADMVVDRGEYLELRRDGDRCAALCGGAVTDGVLTEPYTCRVYADRPSSCSDFENRGEHCLTARRRVGLSR